MRPARWGLRSRRLTSMGRCINCHEAPATTVVLILYCKSLLNYLQFWRWNEEEAQSIGDHNQNKSIPHLCSKENEKVSYDHHERRNTKKPFLYNNFIIWPWNNKNWHFKVQNYENDLWFIVSTLYIGKPGIPNLKWRWWKVAWIFIVCCAKGEFRTPLISVLTRPVQDHFEKDLDQIFFFKSI